MTATFSRTAFVTVCFCFLLAASDGLAATGSDQKAPKPFVPAATTAKVATGKAPVAVESTSQTPATAKAPIITNDESDVPLDGKPTPSVPDPLYAWNKFWFTFNDYFYSGLMRPLATGYRYVMPEMARTGLSNAYNNFTFPIRFLNALLQLDFTKASREFGRFMINTTIGIGGLMDVAKSDPNLQPGNEDFGQTLGHYGVKDGFYIVWPFLGPSTLRDSVGLAGDAVANPLTWIFGPFALSGDNSQWYWSSIIKAGDVFNRLPETLDNYDSIVKPAIEPYSAVKDAYLQYRRNAVNQ